MLRDPHAAWYASTGKCPSPVANASFASQVVETGALVVKSGLKGILSGSGAAPGGAGDTPAPRYVPALGAAPALKMGTPRDSTSRTQKRLFSLCGGPSEVLSRVEGTLVTNAPHTPPRNQLSAWAYLIVADGRFELSFDSLL